MTPFFLAVCCVLAAPPWSPQEVRSVGYLWSADNTRPCPYTPREGDLLLLTSRDKIYTIVWRLAGTGHPYHSMILVRRSTGELEALEVGGGTSHSVTLRLVPERLTALFQAYHGKDPAAWVRQRRTPLTPEQSARLTAFAEGQLGKRFTPTREFLALVPTRGRTYRSGDPKQADWFCSELVATAIEQAGLLPPGAIANPGRLTPRHFHFDQDINLTAEWEPPVRWTGTANPPPHYPDQPLP